jgi:hypothetical protein
LILKARTNAEVYVKSKQETMVETYQKLRVNKDELNKLLHITNQAVQKYGQPPLYTEPNSPTDQSSKKRKKSKSSPEKIPEKIADIQDASVFISILPNFGSWGE